MKIVNNMWLKIAAILSGVLLWLHVVTETEYQHRVSLPITEVTLPHGLTLIERINDSIEVSVSASGKQLIRQSWKKNGLRLNGTELSAGRSIINLTSLNVSLAATSSISLDEVITPTSLQLQVDHMSTERVKVEANLIVSAADGFIVRYISPPDPEEVMVTGPRSIVHLLSSISTEHREIEGLRNRQKVTLAFIYPPEYDLIIDPDTVTLDLDVVASRTMVLDNLPVQLRNAPANELLEIDPATISVEFLGAPDDISAVDSTVFVAFVDYLNREEDGTIPVNIECPGQFKIKKKSAQSVTIVATN